MKKSKLIRNLIVLLIVFPIAAGVISPPDLISQIIIAVQMIIVYGVLSLVISRFKSLAQTPETIKKLIFVLVCLLSITIVTSVTFVQYNYRARVELNKRTNSSTTQVQAVETQ